MTASSKTRATSQKLQSLENKHCVRNLKFIKKTINLHKSFIGYLQIVKFQRNQQ